MTASQQVPSELRSQGVTPRLVRNHIWKPVNQKNEHAMLGIVGREGKGKSYAGLRICEVADPTFTADRVAFSAAEFIKMCRDLPPGRAVFLDEAGVSMGARSWYDKEQIAVNKLLQTIRNENLIGIFTVPNSEEADSQLRSRLHYLLEMVETYPGEGYSVGKWFNVKTFPSDPDRRPIREYPKMSVKGVKRKIKRVSFTPPSNDIVDPYEKRKDEFQEDEYEGTLEMLEDEDGDGESSTSPKDVAEDIIENDEVADFVSIHGGNKTRYISWKLIREERGLSQNEAKTVKTYLEQTVNLEEVDIE